MISDQDLDLLEKSRPDLTKGIELEGSGLLAQLRQRAALRPEQEELIQV